MDKLGSETMAAVKSSFFSVVREKEVLQMLIFLEYVVLLPSLCTLIQLFYSVSVNSGYSPLLQRIMIFFFCYCYCYCYCYREVWRCELLNTVTSNKNLNQRVTYKRTRATHFIGGFYLKRGTLSNERSSRDFLSKEVTPP